MIPGTKFFYICEFEISTFLMLRIQVFWVVTLRGLLIPGVPKQRSDFILKVQGAHDSTLEVIQGVRNL